MTYVIGIDPGPVVGIVGLWCEAWPDPVSVQRIERVDVAQCSASCVVRVLEGFWLPTAFVAAERFVVGPLAARSHDPGAGKVTRAVPHVVSQWASKQRTTYVERSAAEHFARIFFGCSIKYRLNRCPAIPKRAFIVRVIG